MNCDLLQRRLLSLERPERPPAEVQSHLAACPTCREWHRRLVRLEQDVRLLPVPVSTAGATFVARLRAGEMAPVEREETARPSASLPRSRGQRRERALRKLALATALAAGLALFALGWWAAQWPQRHDPGRTSDLVAELVKHDIDLAGNTNPDTRLKVLATMANDLRGQAKPLASADYSEDLQLLAACYEEVVGALPDRARELPDPKPGESVAQALRQAVRETKELAATALGESCAASLTRMASAAQKSADRMQGRGQRAERPDAVDGFETGPHLLCASGGPAGLSALCVMMTSGGLLTSAVGAAPLSEPADPVTRFQKNRKLIPKLVHEGVSLAGLPGDENALERARRCNAIAQGLADEMTMAAERQEGTRVADLGRHLEACLGSGVAFNLSTARGQENKGVSERDLQNVRKITTDLLDELRQKLQGQENTGDALQAIDKGREQVENALRTP
jgi:hypothetical protein